MAVYNAYTVEYYDGSNWVQIDNVISFTCRVGRIRSTDTWSPSTGIVRARYPQGFDSPLTNLLPDARFRWFAPGRSSTNPNWTGYVTNVRTLWDKPWDAGTTTGDGDILEIEFQGALSVWGLGREVFTQFGDVTFAEKIYSNAFQSGLGSATNVPDRTNSRITNPATPSATNPLSWITRAAASVAARIIDGVRVNGWTGLTSGLPGVYLNNYSNTPLASVSFSDTTNDSTHRIYTEIDFDGLGDNYYNEVTVIPESAAEATASTFPVIARVYEIQTYNPSAAVAQDLAVFILNQYETPRLGLSRIVARTGAQHTNNLDTLGFQLYGADVELGYLVAARVAVEFRGETLYGQIEGVELNADLAETIFTYYLSFADAGNWFTLDSADYGELDVDRLGYF